MSNFLTNQQIASLVEAIQSAEDHSTGEIRVHIDSNTEDQHAKTAFEVFKELRMDKTTDRNGVLFYINFEKKYLTIIGDVGIHERVYQSYWDHLHDYMTAEFAKGNYYKALKSAILETGLELKKYFPVEGENPNQLPNEITFS
nr:TPM domain-containing protein [uncultured Chryseobacterium sp.]